MRVKVIICNKNMTAYKFQRWIRRREKSGYWFKTHFSCKSRGRIHRYRILRARISGWLGNLKNWILAAFFINRLKKWGFSLSKTRLWHIKRSLLTLMYLYLISSFHFTLLVCFDIIQIVILIVIKIRIILRKWLKVI